MGKLAKFGIVGGRKVAVEGWLGNCEIRGMSGECLGRFGFRQLAQKIADGQVLSIDDLRVLLHEAPLGVLMKLLEIKRGSPAKLEVYPQIHLPVERMLGSERVEVLIENAAAMLREVPYPKLRVQIGIEEFSNMDLWSEVLTALSHSREGLTFIGPAPEEMLGWLLNCDRRSSKSVRLRRLERLMVRMRVAGFELLSGSCHRGLVRLAMSIGLPTPLITPVDRFRRPEQLAYELVRIRRLLDMGIVTGTWIPGCSLRQLDNDKPLSAGLALRIVRALGVGVLALGERWRFRAWTQGLPADFIALLPYFGANEFAIAAVEQDYEDQMQFPIVQALEKFFPVAGTNGVHECVGGDRE
jgi:hypothetical protein